jgi:NhaP-type Na+/H+ or K+/H+ antiporter
MNKAVFVCLILLVAGVVADHATTLIGTTLPQKQKTIFFVNMLSTGLSITNIKAVEMSPFINSVGQSVWTIFDFSATIVIVLLVGIAIHISEKHSVAPVPKILVVLLLLGMLPRYYAVFNNINIILYFMQ